MMNLKTSVFSVAAALVLTACGGGGGSDSSPATTVPPVSNPAPPVVTPPVITPADLQTSVPTMTYPAVSAEAAFVSEVNKFRQQVGLGLLAQNSLLDKAAQNHLEYVLTNDARNGGTVNMLSFDAVSGRPMWHIEQVGKPKFTGVQESDRAKAAGYPGAYIGEEVSFGGGKGGAAAFASLSGTIYHRAGLMNQGVREIGLAVGADSSQTVTMEIGYQSQQSNAGDFVGVYPANAQTDVGLFTRVETPNPFPDLSTANADFPTKTGYPISVVVKEGVKLEVTTFTMMEDGSPTPLEVRLLTASNDPNRYLSANVAFLVAKATLKPNTTYAVSFKGRAGNTEVTKSWKFTTGS